MATSANSITIAAVSLLIEAQYVFSLCVGNRQGLDSRLLLGLQRLAPRALLVHVRIDETADNTLVHGCDAVLINSSCAVTDLTMAPISAVREMSFWRTTSV